MFKKISSIKKGAFKNTIDLMIQLSVEIAREGREGKRVGTIFVIGDVKEVLKRSKNLILDPFKGHPDSAKKITKPDVRETLKELSQIDGAFLISEDGIAISAGLYINAQVSDIKVPMGLGGRHIAAAYITKVTKAVAISVSESSVVRVFEKGQIVAEVVPEIWVSKASIHIKRPYTEEHTSDLIIITKS